MPRKQHCHNYIYKTTCSVTGKYYIGMHSTSNLEDGYIGSGKRLWLSIRKHGREKHSLEILEFLPDRQSLRKREKEIVSLDLLKDTSCLNMMVGGEGGFISDEQQRHRSLMGAKAHREKMNSDPDYREKFVLQFSEASKRSHALGKIKAPDWNGKKHREETKKRMSESKKITAKGERNSQFGTIWVFDPRTEKAEKIKADQLQEKLDLGYRRGRK